MGWVDEHRKLKVRTNADEPKQASEAIAFGAEGIGLCRTEHMFFDHIDDFREMILADTLEDREKALAKLLPFQRKDFDGLFRAMNGRPVTIRLLDPPLHEFLPHSGRRTGRAGQEDRRAGRGHRPPRRTSCTSSIPCSAIAVAAWASSIPEITRMQARAIFEAACDVKKAGIDVLPEVMIPLVGFAAELKDQEKIVRDTADQGLCREEGRSRIPGRHHDRGAARPPSSPSRSPRRPSSSASAPTT